MVQQCHYVSKEKLKRVSDMDRFFEKNTPIVELEIQLTIVSYDLPR